MGIINRILLASIAAAAFAVLAAPSARCESVDVKITGVQGKVFIMKTTGTTWERATDGVTVREGAKIKTISNAACLLSISGHTIKLTQRSIVSIAKADLTGTTETSLLVVEKGKIAGNVENLPDKNSIFTIRTPSGDAVMRGTDKPASKQ